MNYWKRVWENTVALMIVLVCLFVFFGWLFIIVTLAVLVNPFVAAITAVVCIILLISLFP